MLRGLLGAGSSETWPRDDESGAGPDLEDTQHSLIMLEDTASPARGSLQCKHCSPGSAATTQRSETQFSESWGRYWLFVEWWPVSARLCWRLIVTCLERLLRVMISVWRSWTLLCGHRPWLPTTNIINRWDRRGLREDDCPSSPASHLYCTFCDCDVD